MPPDVPDEAEELLTSEPLVAFLATSVDDEPHAAPLWYNYHEGSIEIATTGRKLENLRKNPRVSFSVQKAEDGHPQWGVTIQGRASVITDETAATETLHRINEKYGAEEEAWAENTSVRIEPGAVEYWEY